MVRISGGIEPTALEAAAIPDRSEQVDDLTALWFNGHVGALAALPDDHQRAVCGAIERAGADWRRQARPEQQDWARQRREPFDCAQAALRLADPSEA